MERHQTLPRLHSVKAVDEGLNRLFLTKDVCERCGVQRTIQGTSVTVGAGSASELLCWCFGKEF